MAEEDTKNCPFCGGEIKNEAKKCRHCGKWLNEQLDSQVIETGTETKPQTKQCPACGEEILAEAKKCKFCGNWIGEHLEKQVIEEKPKTKQCPACGEEILAEARKCKHCGEILGNFTNVKTNNNYYNSYFKPQKPLPFELQKFNWGAFGCPWLWGLYNNCNEAIWAGIGAWLAAAIIPFIGSVIGLGINIWLGIKGNELAWNSKDWESTEKFNSVQIAWAKGVIAITIFWVGMTISTMFYFMWAATFHWR